MSKVKKVRKPKDIFDDFLSGHTFCESFNSLCGSRKIEVNILTHDSKEMKRTIKWLTQAIAWLEQKKGEK